MIIHSNILTSHDIYSAARLAGAKVVSCEQRGSKSRARAFNVYLSGHSPFAPGFGRRFGDGVKAASWDEWGMFLAKLYEIDPCMHNGKTAYGGYQSAEHFHWITNDRFRTLTPEQQHKRHKWSMGMPNWDGMYSEAYCDCGATLRWILKGHWDTQTESLVA